MKYHRVALNTQLPASPDKAPDVIELIPGGTVGGRDGRGWTMDANDAKAVIADFVDRKADLPIDWEHSTQHRAPRGEEAPAAAWIEGLELRPSDGALLGRVSWTERGANQVRSREYRYLSPVFDFDPATKRIVRLVSAGLTNKPNLPLQALNTEEPLMNRSALLIAALAGLSLKPDADDDAIATAINQLTTDRDAATTRALNAERAQPDLARYVPRDDYNTLATRATNAENALRERDQAALKVDVDTTIAAALKAGKITPATEAYHRASCSDQAGLDRFKEFVGVAPAVGDESSLGARKPKNTDTALNAEEQAAARHLGMSHDEYRKARDGDPA
jgi:phage I-like protein